MREALRLPAKELLDEAVRRYRAWKAERPTDPASIKPAELPVVDKEEAVIATERAFVLETAESEARGEIEDFVTALGPYEFQELVAALLRGMGYSTPHIARRVPSSPHAFTAIIRFQALQRMAALRTSCTLLSAGCREAVQLPPAL